MLWCIFLFIAGCVICSKSQQPHKLVKSSIQLERNLYNDQYFVAKDFNQVGNTTQCQYDSDSTNGEVPDDRLKRHKRQVPKPSFWEDWQPWSECTDSCNAGYRTRTRICVDTDGEVATICKGKFMDSETCNDFPCPKKKKEMSRFEMAKLRRQRLVDSGMTLDTKQDLSIKPLASKSKYASNHFGSKTGLYSKQQSKTRSGGRWTAWMSWGKCSQSCLGGIRERYRTCMTPDMQISTSCYGEFIERSECEYITCEKAKEKAKQEELERNPVSSMSGEVSQDLVDRILRGEKINANWGEWGSWGGCSVSCQTGTRTRYRMCVTPEGEVAPGCTGESMESGLCNQMSCEEAKQNMYSGLTWDFEDSTIKKKKGTGHVRPPTKTNTRIRPNAPPKSISQKDSQKLPNPRPPNKPSRSYSEIDAPNVAPINKGPYSRGDAPKLQPIVGRPKLPPSPYSNGDAPRVAPIYNKIPNNRGDAPKLQPIARRPKLPSSPYSDGDAPKVAPIYNKSPYSRGDAPKLQPIAGLPKQPSSPYSDGDSPNIPPVYKTSNRPSGPHYEEDSNTAPIAVQPKRPLSPYNNPGNANEVALSKSRQMSPYTQNSLPKSRPIVPPRPTSADDQDYPDSRLTGNWGEWMMWQQCSATCGKGLRVRDRQCDSPPPTGGGEPCFGNNIQSETCAADTLCVDGTMIHELTVTIGLDARLSCDAEWYLVHHPDATIVWYKDQTIIPLSDKIQEIGLGDLQITGVNQQSEGVYACAVTKDEQTYYNNVVLLKIKTTMTLMEVATTQPQRLVVPILLPLIILVLAVVTLRREYQRMKAPSGKRQKNKKKPKKNRKKDKKAKKKEKVDTVSENSSDNSDGDGGGTGGPPPPPPPSGAAPSIPPPAPSSFQPPPGPAMPAVPAPGPAIPSMPLPPRPPMPAVQPPGPSMLPSPRPPMPRPPMPGGPPSPSTFGGPAAEGAPVRPPMALNLLESIKNH